MHSNIPIGPKKYVNISMSPDYVEEKTKYSLMLFLFIIMIYDLSGMVEWLKAEEKTWNIRSLCYGRPEIN